MNDKYIYDEHNRLVCRISEAPPVTTKTPNREESVVVFIYGFPAVVFLGPLIFPMFLWHAYNLHGAKATEVDDYVMRIPGFEKEFGWIYLALAAYFLLIDFLLLKFSTIIVLHIVGTFVLWIALVTFHKSLRNKFSI